jgi:hypothetical protein
VANILAKGTQAPEFTLHVTPDQTLSLNEFAGRRVILAFYPADWSPVCGDRMTLYNHILPEFRRRGAELPGISVDGAWCHRGLRRPCRHPRSNPPRGRLCNKPPRHNHKMLGATTTAEIGWSLR